VTGHAHEGLRYSVAGAEPAVYAGRTRLSLDPAMSGAGVRADLEAFVRALASRLVADGCVLIGHVKGALDAGEQGRLAFSLTSVGDEPRWTGTLSGQVELLDVTLNVIVFGVTDTSTRDAVLACWSAKVSASAQWH
jgi:hypothetical protein